MKKQLSLVSFTLVLLTSSWAQAQTDDVPLRVRENLYDKNQPTTLALSFAEGTETYTVYRPGIHESHYNHGVVLFPFHGTLYAQWQTSATDEDEAGTHVLFSKSDDGVHWSTPERLTQPKRDTIMTSGGWWSYGDTLVAFINVWPDPNTKQGYCEYQLSTDGMHWSTPKCVRDSMGNPILGVIEQDLHALPSGRIIAAFHMQPGLVATPCFTDQSTGVSGWTLGRMQNLSINKGISRELEPSSFVRSDGSLVMIFRDQNSSYMKLASVSMDTGKNWSKPVLVNAADSRAKQSAGNLPDGTAYMVNNPSGTRDRFPLVITLSRDGFIFEHAYLLRSGESLPPIRYSGKYKRPGFSYPKSIIWGDSLYIGYATNKEDVEITRVPIRSLQFN